MKMKLKTALIGLILALFVLPASATINDVKLQDLESSYSLGEQLELSASSDGYNIQELRIEKSTDKGFSWTTLKKVDCLETSNCDTSTSYSHDEEGEVKFRARAVTESDASNDRETVTFNKEQGSEDRIDNVEVEVSQKRVEFGESIRIEAKSDGEELQQLRIEKSTDKFAWTSLKEVDCLETSNCDTSISHTHSSGAEEVYYRARIVTDNHAKNDVQKIDYYKETGSSKPDIDLRKPSDGATGVSLTPTFKWRIYNYGGDISNVDIRVEEKDYSGDKPWNQGRKFSVTSGTRSEKSYTPDQHLDPDTEYIWGIEADHNGDEVRSEVFSFKTKDDDTDNGDDDEDTGSLKVTVKDRDYDRLENARVRIENGDRRNGRTDDDGEIKFRDLQEDRYEIRVKCEGESETDSRYIDEGESDSVAVRMDLGSSDNYCDRDDDDTDNGESDVEAFFTVSKTNPRVGESVRFDASGSEGDIKEYRWTFPSGKTEYGKTIYRSFSTSGSKKVRLKVTEVDGDSDSYSRTLNVQQTERCGLHVGSLNLQDSSIEEGDSTEASIRLSNTGDLQDFRIKIFRDSTKLLDESTSVSRGGSKRFKTDVTADSDSDIRAEIRTSGGPCGSQFFERSRTLDVDKDDRDDDDNRRPTARLDIEPSNADIGEEVEFDARESSDPDGEIEEYEFDLDGDGDYETSNDDGEVERTFFEEIDTRAKVRVIDDDGYTDTDSERYRVRAKSRVSFSDISIPDDVCAGESFDVTFNARNIGDDERILIVEGEGFGDRNSYSTHLEEDEEEEVTITFTTDQPGTEEFTITSVGGNSDSIENSIEVLDCASTGEEVEGISMKVVPDRVKAGESVKISGYVDNARGRQDVEIEMNNRRLKEISTEPDGYYSTYIYPERTGNLELAAKTDRHRATRSLTVLPTVTVGSIETPETVFQGDEIEICADVNSQRIPSVVLRVDGEIVESKNERGNVCFDTTAKKQGDVEYEVAGFARGQQSSSSRTLKVHEAKPEASSFPGQVASVESGRGIVKATVYNNNDRRKTYNVNIGGLPDTWTSTTDKQVILQPGEQREVFFYLTPREEGSYSPLVTITSDREIVYTEEVDVEVGGTSKPANISLWQRLRNAFL
jgi:hypothetical protein